MTNKINVTDHQIIVMEGIYQFQRNGKVFTKNGSPGNISKYKLYTKKDTGR